MACFMRNWSFLSVFSILTLFIISPSTSFSLQARAQQQSANDGTLLINIANHNDVPNPSSQGQAASDDSSSGPTANDGTHMIIKPSPQNDTNTTTSKAQSLDVDPWLNATFATSNNQSTLSANHDGLYDCDGSKYGQGLSYSSCGGILAQIPGDNLLRIVGSRQSSRDYQIPFRLMSCKYSFSTMKDPIEVGRAQKSSYQLWFVVLILRHSQLTAFVHWI